MSPFTESMRSGSWASLRQQSSIGQLGDVRRESSMGCGGVLRGKPLVAVELSLVRPYGGLAGQQDVKKRI